MNNNRYAPGTFLIVMVGLSLIFSSCTPKPVQPPTSTPTSYSSSTSTLPALPISTLTLIATDTSTQVVLAPWTRPADGMMMVYVPEGNFEMGSTSRPDQIPEHTVYLDAYWIDQTEVTNAMYEQCEQAGKCPLPLLNSSSTRASYHHNAQYANYPVVFVGWQNAQAYCKWAGVGLPTEAQWEKAARGTDGRLYPWGNDLPTSALLNYNSNVGDTTEVGSYPSGASPYGALDMAGNVSEWTMDWYGDTYYVNSPASNPTGPASGLYRVRRGGSWDLEDTLVTNTNFRIDSNPKVSLNSVGFRCARSAAASYTYVTPTITPTSTPAKPNLADFFVRCPTADEIADVNSRLTITFEDDPSAGTLACTAAAGSADLSTIQKKAYQTIIIMKYLQFDEPLPWTDKQLYDWFTGAVKGIRFIWDPSQDNPAPSFCCKPAYILDIMYSPHNFLYTLDVWTNASEGAGLADITGLLIHEARHAEGNYEHLYCPGRPDYLDPNLAYMGSTAVEYYFYFWLAKHSQGDFFNAPSTAVDETYHRAALPNMYRDSMFYNAYEIRLHDFCIEPTMTPGGFTP